MIKIPATDICTQCNEVDLSSIEAQLCLDCYTIKVEQLRAQIAKFTIAAALARLAGDTIKARIIHRQRKQVIDQLEALKAKEEAA